ncbi:type II toxin-antitoxin system prevent-host-death family antitoxin [bacterium]|nr:type II toxin-antitoxin system prevent-host-death family antitoxin [bacterium]
MKATAKDLRFHSKEILDTVSRGEEVIITYRGRAQAKIVPIDTDTAAKEQNASVLFGIWKDHPDSDNADKYVRDIRKGRFQ